MELEDQLAMVSATSDTWRACAEHAQSQVESLSSQLETQGSAERQARAARFAAGAPVIRESAAAYATPTGGTATGGTATGGTSMGDTATGGAATGGTGIAGSAAAIGDPGAATSLDAFGEFYALSHDGRHADAHDVLVEVPTLCRYAITGGPAEGFRRFEV